ncbi:hypothetical protein JB92DRAFT_579944 [Gautieria morchelliformis]|nr:hypothetical protein JB92DRAFT_579944 [Gautieria morchelliformis]
MTWLLRGIRVEGVFVHSLGNGALTSLQNTSARSPTARRLLSRASRLLHAPCDTPQRRRTPQRSNVLVADTVPDKVLSLWEGTAKKNRDIFTEVFRPVPSDFVQDWQAYKVRDQLVEMPLRFLADEKDFVDNADSLEGFESATAVVWSFSILL